MQSRDGAAKRGVVQRPRSEIQTPAVIPEEKEAYPLLDLLQKYVLESGFEFHVTDGSNQIET